MFWRKRRYPTPTHLVGVLVADAAQRDATSLSGRAVCSCGGEVFVPLYVGDRVVGGPDDIDVGPHFLRVAEIGDAFFLRLGARCVACAREHLLFDSHFHGWNGYVCGSSQDRALPRPSYTGWNCHACAAPEHAIALSISGEEEAIAIGEADGALTRKDWFNAFGWLEMAVTCKSCGAGPSTIVNYETM